MKSAIFAPTAGVFAALRDEKVFREVRVEMGALVWPGDIDVAPDARIHVAGPEGVRARFTLAELLPESFGPENLG